MKSFVAQIDSTAVLEAWLWGPESSEDEISLTLYWLWPMNIPDHPSDIEHMIYLNLLRFLPNYKIWEEIRSHSICSCIAGKGDRPLIGLLGIDTTSSEEQWTQIVLTTTHAEELYEHMVEKISGNPTLKFITR